MKQFIKSLIPPILFNFIQAYRNRNYGWHGDYATWQDAQKVATGYDGDEIVQKVRTSLLRVKKGEAVFERDSVVFDEVHYSWPLLAGLMFAAIKCNGSLKVLDFGGSLGSTYYQNKRFLDRLDNVSWNIVEQTHFVDIGKADFEDNRLKFYYDIESCMSIENPNVLILSSVLQYIEKPYELLDKLLKYNFQFILVDRTPFYTRNQDKITLQTVSPSIYSASYPCRFFNMDQLKTYFTSNLFKELETFEAIDGSSSEYRFKGYIFQKAVNV